MIPIFSSLSLLSTKAVDNFDLATINMSEVQRVRKRLTADQIFTA